MKMTSFLPLLTLFSLSAGAAPLEYACECIDTGAECEGMENLNITISGKKAVIELGSSDWESNDQFGLTLNPKYSPRSKENANYSQYKITSGGGASGYNVKRSTFLVENTLLKGRKTGDVKFESIQNMDTGGGYYSWVFECEKAN